MTADAPPEGNGRFTLDKRVNLGLVLSVLLQLAVIIVGGIWAAGRVQGNVDTLTKEIADMKEAMSGGFRDLRADLNRANDRIDRLAERPGPALHGVP